MEYEGVVGDLAGCMGMEGREGVSESLARCTSIAECEGVVGDFAGRMGTVELECIVGDFAGGMGVGGFADGKGMECEGVAGSRCDGNTYELIGN